MARSRQRTSGIFTGLVLLTVGALLLLHNYRGLELGDVLLHWWPLALIFLGLIKLYERTVARRSDDPDSARISGGEILLVIGMITLLSVVVAVDYAKRTIPGHLPIEFSGDAYPFDLDVAPMSVPANARITVRGGHGEISVRASDTPEIRVSGKKNVHAWSETDAQRRAGPVSVEIVQNGDGYEIHPTGMGVGDEPHQHRHGYSSPEEGRRHGSKRSGRHHCLRHGLTRFRNQRQRRRRSPRHLWRREH